LIQFFEEEVKSGRVPKNLLPLQSGIGNIANSIVGGLANGPFNNLSVWTEVIQDTFLDVGRPVFILKLDCIANALNLVFRVR
jgi:acetyl-CoA hydrolase